MPLVRLCLSEVREEAKEEILRASAAIIAEVTGKTEKNIMAVIENGTFLMAGTQGAGAFVDVKGIGKIEPEINAEISRGICELIMEKTDIPQERIFLNFTDVPATNWGANGTTVGQGG